MDSDDEVPELIAHAAPAPLAPNPVSQPPMKVPLTIITGFLGSGKSTFLKYVLTEKHGYRIAIIMNEFGDTADIEGRAISVSSPNDPSSLATEFLELANGCLCCSIKDTGVAAIEKLMRKQGAFDYIMLETTGLADPGPIAATFWQNEDFSEQIVLDGVVCIVDGVFGLKELESENRTASRQQIALADITLLNKVDLAKDTEVLALEREIRHINPTTPIIQTTHGKVDLARVLNTGAYNSFKANQPEHVHDAECDHQHDLESISSVQIQLPTLTEAQVSKLDEWIRSVLWEKKLPGASDGQTLEVLRCKGIYSLTSGKSHLLQGVQTLYDVTELDSSEGVGEGKIVLIGRGLSSGIADHLKQYLSFRSTNV